MELRSQPRQIQLVVVFMRGDEILSTYVDPTVRSDQDDFRDVIAAGYEHFRRLNPLVSILDVRVVLDLVD